MVAVLFKRRLYPPIPRAAPLQPPHSQQRAHCYSGDTPITLQLPCQCFLVDQLDGFAVGTQVHGTSLFPLVP